MITSQYYEQAKLLTRIFDPVFTGTEFALRGGTAINFFFRNMPRYSVDLDLTYIKVAPRAESLRAISEGLRSMSERIKRALPGSEIEEYKGTDSNIVEKLYVYNDNTKIKIETSTTIRGTIYSCEERPLCSKASEAFNAFATARTLSFAEIYGSKICAALDRQHPRDIYDIMLLLKNEGITERVRKAFLVYLISHNRPIAELLLPKLSDMKPSFENEFAGMADDADYSELVVYREKLVKEINEKLKTEEKLFLLSFKKGKPEWNLLGVAGVKDLPAVNWKLENLNRMKKEKHEKAVEKLKQVLE